MKILRIVRDEEYLTHEFGPHTPFHKILKEKYDYDMILLPDETPDSEKAELIRKYDVLLTDWFTVNTPAELADNPGNLKYICNITGGLDHVPEELVACDKIPVTNWGDAVGYSLGDGTANLLMMMLKGIPTCINDAVNGEKEPHKVKGVSSLYKTKIGIYGFGFIARRFVEILRPFEPEFYAFDPYVDDMPEGVKKVDSLEELFSVSEIISLHAGLTPETEGAITKEHLAMLPDGAIFINTARGAIVDEDALLEEIVSGRIRAGIDVMKGGYDNEMPPIGHPSRYSDCGVYYGHAACCGHWGFDDKVNMTYVEKNCLANLERFEKGEPLKFIVDIERYKRMT